MQDKREIPSIVNEKTVIKCCNFHTLGGSTPLVMALRTDEQTDLHALNKYLFSLDKVSFKKNSMSLNLVHLEKLFTQTPMSMRMQIPQSDFIMSADLSAI